MNELMMHEIFEWWTDSKAVPATVVKLAYKKCTEKGHSESDRSLQSHQTECVGRTCIWHRASRFFRFVCVMEKGHCWVIVAAPAHEKSFVVLSEERSSML